MPPALCTGGSAIHIDTRNSAGPQGIRSSPAALRGSVPPARRAPPDVPQGIDVAKVMDVVRKVALQQGVESPCPDIDEFYRALLSSINITGRSFEPWIIARLKMLTGNITEDLALGFTMFRKGKLAIIPRISDNIGELRKDYKAMPGKRSHQVMNKRFALYEGLFLSQYRHRIPGIDDDRAGASWRGCQSH